MDEKSLYLAPMNFFSNFVFRHFLLLLNADFVFSELIMIEQIDKEIRNKKLKIFSEDDLEKTIFQIGAKNIEEINVGVKLLKKEHPLLKEINLNVGCPQSSMQKKLVCSGLLFDESLMESLFKELVLLSERLNFIPSVKIRLGLDPNQIKIKDYLNISNRSGIKKVYIHARTLRYNYTKPALYDALIDLKKSFPDMELIFNGDVDSYTRFEKLIKMGADGVMIGRASLSNPEIFVQIKKQMVVRSENYDPYLNDPNLELNDGRWFLKQHKKDLIISFIDLAKKELKLEVIKTHILYFIKGVSNRSELIREIRNADDVDDLLAIFN